MAAAIVSDSAGQADLKVLLNARSSSDRLAATPLNDFKSPNMFLLHAAGA
jgi:hypothetical protein